MSRNAQAVKAKESSRKWSNLVLVCTHSPKWNAGIAKQREWS